MSSTFLCSSFVTFGQISPIPIKEPTPSAQRSQPQSIISYTHANTQGDIVLKTDDIGGPIYQSTYQAFGTRLQEKGATLDRQRANTKDEDPTELLNEGYRYYVKATVPMILS